MKSLGRVDVSQNFKLFVPTCGIPAGLHSHREAHVSLKTPPQSTAVICVRHGYLQADLYRPTGSCSRPSHLWNAKSSSASRRVPTDTSEHTDAAQREDPVHTTTASSTQSVKFRWLCLLKF